MKKRPSNRLSPKANKVLLAINVLIFFAALVLAVLNVDVKEYIAAVAMLFVMFVTGANIYGCLKRLNLLNR